MWQEASLKNYENKSTDKDTSAWMKHLIAGGFAGAVSRTCTAPLDRIKVTLQVSLFNVTLPLIIKQMMEEGGLRSFWRGNGINVAKVIPEMATKFTIYDGIKNKLKTLKGKSELEVMDRLVAGSMAGMISQSLIFPLEVLKTRLVLRTSSETCRSCIQRVFSNKNNMLRNLFRGYVPNIIGIIPYAGIDLAIYETLKREYMSQQSDSTEPQTLVLLTCGVVSSSCGQIVSYPLNLIKTRFQAQLGFLIVNEKFYSEPDCSLVSTVRTIVVSDGLSGLYRGLSANLMKVAPSVAIGYVVYEHSRSFLGASMS
ncbi:hypothetical protein HELRODRAFT_89164 [Helobdella robusta]|uniref:Uncharacterized protein n=1 Tax=Helobdella robusta TaxID=6412 RepID=T1G794_HELRO|nr:hypothetical protein HELRODRAFT_89164 [Helobdella robusta]ESN93250.1 hypothetical protein HELRODRAFT_89164 [Helobdella robusta]